MNTITRTPQINIGDDITLDDEKEGRVISKTIAGIITNIFEGEGYIRKVKPTEIIALRRGRDFFKVSIKSNI
jgi:hypothetical protein